MIDVIFFDKIVPSHAECACLVMKPSEIGCQRTGCRRTGLLVKHVVAWLKCCVLCVLQMFSALILGLIVGSIYYQLCSSCDSGIQNRSAHQPNVFSHFCVFEFDRVYANKLLLLPKLFFIMMKIFKTDKCMWWFCLILSAMLPANSTCLWRHGICYQYFYFHLAILIYFFAAVFCMILKWV